MAITTMDGIVAGLNNRKTIVYPLSTSSTVTALQWLNTQRTNGPVQMAVPASYTSGGTIHTETEDGFFNLGTPTGTRYLAKIDALSTGITTFAIHDRVWSCSGFDATITTAQNIVGFPTLTRPNANGTNLTMWLEVYTALGSTSANIVVTYTNQSGVTGRTTAAIATPTGLQAGRLVPFTLQTGDTGVKSIQSVSLSTSTGTAGNFGITLLSQPYTYVPFVSANSSAIFDFASLGLPAIQSGAALNILQKTTTAVTASNLNMHFIEG